MRWGHTSRPMNGALHMIQASPPKQLVALGLMDPWRSQEAKDSIDAELVSKVFEATLQLLLLLGRQLAFHLRHAALQFIKEHLADGVV